MSDGEKAALYLAATVLSEPAGAVVVVDEPETHFHSLLAVHIWNVLESERPDLRFVYITHDLHFALSRQCATFMVMSPNAGYQIVQMDQDLTSEMAEVLLGTASFSFYARRIIFCEGEETSLDVALYRSWFNGIDSVVRPVGGCETVLRCVTAFNHEVVVGLTSIGLVDRDVLPDGFIQALPAEVTVLGVHEIESVYCLPGVIAAVASHLKQDFDLDLYTQVIRGSISDLVIRKAIVDRWKRRLEPHLESIVSGVKARNDSIESISADIPNLFDHTQWTFSPTDILETERTNIESSASTGNLEDLLRVFPGKGLIGIAAGTLGIDSSSLVELVNKSLSESISDPTTLSAALEGCLTQYLPARSVPAPGAL